MNIDRTVKEIKQALATYNNFRDRNDKKGMNAQRSYIESRCIDWLTLCSMVYKINKNFIDQKLKSEKNVRDRYTKNDVSPIINDETQHCCYRDTREKLCGGLFRAGHNQPIKICVVCHYWKGNAVTHPPRDETNLQQAKKLNERSRQNMYE